MEACEITTCRLLNGYCHISIEATRDFPVAYFLLLEVIPSKIISLDQSSVATGWALFVGSQLAKYGVINMKKEKNAAMRVRNMELLIASMIHEEHPDSVIIEDVSLQTNVSTLVMLARLQGAIQYMAIENGSIVEIYKPSHWRKGVGIKTGKGIRRSELKQAAKQLVFDMYGIQVSDDVADAILIGQCALNEYKEKNKMSKQANEINYCIEGKEERTVIKDNVSLAELMQAIQDGFDLCCSESGEFHPELMDYAIEYECLLHLTDIDLGNTAESAYRYIRAIDGVPSVDADFIADGIRAKIDYHTKMTTAAMISMSSDNLASQIGGVIEKFNGILDAASSLLEKLSAGVPDDGGASISALMEALTKADFSESNIVNKVLDYQEAKARSKGAKKPIARKAPAKKGPVKQ